MSDDLKKTGPQDSRKINVHEKHELEYWIKVFGIPKKKLIAIVEKVGTSVDDVKKHLQN